MKRVSKLILVVAILVLVLTMLFACAVKIGINFIVDGETYYNIKTAGQEEIEFPNPPSKDGYVFKGWYWDENVWTKPFTAYSLLDQPLSSFINVYAYFITQEEADALKIISFNTMGAGNIDPIEVKQGTLIQEPNTLTREGYLFIGWYQEADFTTKWNFNTNTVSSDMTLYAKWVEDIPENRLYTVSFNSNGGSILNDISEITYNSTISKPANPVLDGYALVGWYTDNTYAKEWNFTFDTVRENITLYARWAMTDVSACSLVSADGFEINGKELFIKTPNDQITFSFIDKIVVSAFASWEIVNDLQGQDVVPSRTVEIDIGDNTKYILVTSYDGLHRNFYTVTIRRRPIYTVNLIHNDGSEDTLNAMYEEDSYIDFPDLTLNGYTLTTWQDTEENPWNIEEDTVQGNTVLNAVWEANDYTVSFDADGGSTVNDTTVTYDEEFNFEVPQKVGYNFLGWEYDNTILTDGNGESIRAWNIDNTVTVKAVYGAIRYNITYENLKGANNTNVLTYTIEQSVTFANVSQDGYIFNNWIDEENATIAGIEVGNIGDRKITADWTLIGYNAIFKVDGVELEKRGFNVETTSIQEPSVPTKTGYTGGWSEYSFIARDIVIDAIYTPIVYTITYDNVSGQYDVDSPINNNPTTYTIEDETITLNNASKTGYTFLNWTDESSNEVTTIASGTYGNRTIRANWNSIVYTLTLVLENSNGGYDGHYANGQTNPEEFTVEDKFTFIEPICDIRGYEFKGWYTTKNEEGEKFTGIALGTVGNKLYYAQWQRSEYTIRYHNIDNSTNSNPNSYNVESETFTLVDPSKIGYTFDGWYNNADFTTPANTTIAVGSIGELDFHAKWSLVVYDITYILYEGTNDSDNPTTYTFEDNIVLKAPTKAGYTFGGWYDNSDFKNKVDTIELGTTGAISLYARWHWVATITFDSNSGSAVQSIKQEYGTQLVPPTNPTRDYYDFVGWFVNLTDEESYEFTTMPDVDFTLYAKWSPIVYTITYVLNGGVNDVSNPESYTVEESVALNNATKTGYSFVAWYTNAGFTSAPISELVLGSHGDITLYANFAINQYSITFDPDGGSAVSTINQDYNTVVTEPANPAKNAYRFDGWYNKNNERFVFDRMPAYNVELKAKWTPISYKINYGLGGGTNNSDNPATYTIENANIVLKNPTKRGYNFMGWYTNTDYTEQVSQIMQGSYGTVDVQAKWEIISYTITYVNAEELSHENPSEYTVEESITFTPIDKLGYTYHGLFNENTFDTKISGIEQGSIGDVTVYAKYTVNNYDVWMDGKSVSSYTVSFDVNGGVGSFASQTITATNSLSYPGNPTRKNHVFGGWYTNRECNGEIYDFTAIVKDDVTLYAKWVPVSGDIINIGESKSVSVNGTELFEYSFIPLLSGDVSITTMGNVDTFGYLYDVEGNLLASNDDDGADSNFLIKYNATAGRLYTVKFRGYSKVSTGVVTLTVSGNTQIPYGGVAAEPGGKINVTFGTAFTLSVPTREGYVFRGWADIDGVMYTDASGNSIKNFDKGEETVMYSQWEVDGFTITFVTNNGTDVSPVTLLRGARLDINQYVTTRSGYSFNGWYLSASDTESYNASVMPDHNITLYAKWKTYAINTIKYDESITYVSEFITVTADTFGATCFDTDGKIVPMTVTINGTQTSGNTVTVRYTATSNGKTKTATIEGVKVYGLPTLTVGTTQDYINLEDGFNPTWFNATAIDVYGQAIMPEVAVDGEYNEGDIVSIIISATDIAGNTTTERIDNIKLYGLPVITYDTTLSGISSSYTTSSGNPALGATAVDSFGNALTVSTVLKGSAATTTADAEYTVSISGQTLRSYDFTATASGTVTIYTTGDIDTCGYLYYNGSSVKSDDDSGENTNFKITYTVTQGRTYTVKVCGYSSSTSGTTKLYIKGNITSGTTTLSELCGKDGQKIMIILTATDGKGNTQTLILNDIKVYGTPTINDPTKTDFKVTDEITVNSLGVTANDTFGEAVSNIEITYVSGTQSAGTTRIVTIRATDGAQNVSAKQFTVNVYGDVNIEYPQGIKESANLNKTEFGLTVKDSFGTDLDATVEYVSGQQVGGQSATYRISATDAAGNIYTEEKTFRVYALEDIYLTYDAFSTDKIKLSSKGEEFSAEATDSFGEACEISIENSNGDAIVAGQLQNIVIVATDKAGNRYLSEVISSIGVYYMPNVTHMLNNDNGAWCKELDDDIYFMFSATDSFGDEVYVDIQIIGGDINGMFTARITAVDDANNIFSEDFVVHNYYTLTTTANEVNPGTFTKIDNVKIGAGISVTLSLTTNLGYECGWYEGEVLISENGSYTFDMPAKNVVYTARWTLKEELANFDFSSTTENFTIEGIKDKTVTEITIPYYVTRIGNSAFENCYELTTVSWNAINCTKAGSSSAPIFKECQNLSTVNIGNNVKSIPSYAFYYCSGLTSITIPDSVTSIGGDAFSGCSGLTSIIIPDSVTSIGDYAFSGCSGLTSATMGNGVTSIGDYAFYCSGLTSVIIPDSVTSIGANAFSNCSRLTSITVGSGNTKYLSAGNCIIESASKTLIAGCVNSVIPTDGKVTIIGNYAFYCSSLTSIALPDCVTSIGDYAFYCSWLTSVIIPDSVMSIGESAFQDCISLTEITIPDSVTSIGNAAFSDTAWYTNQPDGVVYAGKVAYKYKGTMPANTSIVLETGTKGIAAYAFNECSGLKRITIPDSVTNIGDYTFYNCSGLTSVTMGNGVTSIGDHAFRYCSGLTNVTIPDSVTSIGDYAFNSTRLESIIIPDSVTSIGNNAFSFAWLTSVTIGNGVTMIGDYAFSDCGGLTSVVIGNGVISIGKAAFRNCSKLTGITIPDSVTSIGNNAFENCSKLTGITIPDSVTSIGNNAFRECMGLTSVMIGDGVTSIGDGAFCGCSGLRSIIIPDSVTSIGDSAFNGCSRLTSITIGNGVVSIGVYAFRECIGLTNVTIGNGVASIGGDAFYGCSGLKSIYYIGDISEWCGITGLENIVSSGRTLYISGLKVEGNLIIPDGVTGIGNCAFRGCSGLTSITIPDSVTSIGALAFYNCSGLTRINFGGSQAQWKAISKGTYWKSNTGTFTVYCTDGTIRNSDA